MPEVQNAVRAWLLFGGYGSRTRRGLGSFRVLDGPEAWLPRAATREEFGRVFGQNIFIAPANPAADTAWFAGASVHVGQTQRDAQAAWTAALEWLKEFRQGYGGSLGDRAREPGAGNRPSISNWPEADKIRRLTAKTTGHKPRHNATPAWPRACFGLPIVGQFQKKARDEGNLEEPSKFELRWRDPAGKEHERLASPLIVKAMPLADGSFVPCALWLNRAYPANGEVILKGVGGSAAPFDLLISPGDTAKFSVLAGKTSLRQAFLDWLRTHYSTSVVAP